MSRAVGKAPSWAAEAAGALNATASSLPFVLSFGFFAYGALGEGAARIGLSASLVAVVVGGAVMLLFSRAQLPIGSPSTSTSLILGGMVIAMLRDARLAPTSSDGLALLLAATSIVVVGSGLLMIALGLAGAGRLVRYVPRPVLAGFMNGVAILLVVSQLPPLLGLSPNAWAREGLRSLAAWQMLPVAIACGTALLLGLIRRRWPKAPAAILAMAGAGVVVALWQAHAEPGSAAASLQRVGTLALALPHADMLAPWLGAANWRVLGPHADTLVTTTIVLTLIGAMESVLNLAAVDEVISASADPDRELMALGAANVASGALGGLPLVYMRLRALATWSGGGRSRRSVWIGWALMGLVVVLGSPLLERLSTAVLAGVIVMLAWALADQWTGQLVRRWWAGPRSPDVGWNIAVVALVCGVTLGWGFAMGVLAGMVVAVWIFVRAMNRQLVRARFTAATLPSRRVYGASDEKRLATLRERIVVLELEGALFFGSAERLLEEAGRLPAGASTLILDLRRVSNVDASGAVTLAKVARQLGQRGIVMRLSGVRPGERHARALADHGVLGPGAGGLLAHPDLDRAVEAAERDALADDAARTPGAAVPLTQCHLFDGLTASQSGSLVAVLRERRLDAGERLFRQGEPGRALYVLTAGSISILDPQRGQRFVSFQPGMCLGETAVLDGGGRTGDAVADVPTVVHELDIDDFLGLQAMQPELAARVYRNLATHLSQRLRAAAAAWRHAAE